MGEKFHKGQGQIVHWWQHVRWEEDERLKSGWDPDKARTDDNRAPGARILGSG